MNLMAVDVLMKAFRLAYLVQVCLEIRLDWSSLFEVQLRPNASQEELQVVLCFVNVINSLQRTLLVKQ